MKKTLHIFGVIALLAIASFTAVSTVQDARSTQILNKVSKTYKAYTTMKASFTVNVKNKQGQSSVNQTGKLYVKGKKFRVEMAGQEIYCDGTTVWTYLQDANEVVITDYDESSMGISPSSIFTIHEKGFLHKYAGKKTVKGKALDKIDMTPTDKKKPYFMVSLLIDSKTGRIQDMTVKAKNGTSTAYGIASFAANTPIKDAFFVFNSKSKPGVVEIDYR